MTNDSSSKFPIIAMIKLSSEFVTALAISYQRSAISQKRMDWLIAES